MASNPAQVLSRYTQIYGDTFRIYLGGLKEAIITIDPAVIQHVLKTNAENYHKSEIQVKRMGHFLGKGLLTTEGEAWRNQRRLIQKGFGPKQLDALSAIMQDSVADSLQDFETKIHDGPVDIYPHLMKITFSMVARSLFGARLKDEDIDLVSHTICTVQEFIVRQTLQPYLNPWFAASGDLRKHEEMRTRADAVLMEYIQRRRNEAPGHDLLQTLMDARYSDGEGMPDELVLSESMQLLVAGHETSSNGLSWLLYLLSSRFTKEEMKRRTPFTYLPFGGGPRVCIGQHYAMLQILMILSELLRTYDFQLAPGQTIEARPMVILRPKHGIRMTFTKTIAPAPCIA
jgi:cytochrome P450